MAIIGYVWQTVRIVSTGDPYLARLTMGLAAFLAANSLVFITAHQAYGDVFVLLIIGFILGFIFAIRRLFERTHPTLEQAGKALMHSGNVYPFRTCLMPRP